MHVESDNVMQRTRVENAAYVIEQLNSLGLFPAPESRLMRMWQAMDREYVPPDDPAFLTVLEAERDLQHLGFAFDQMHVHRDNLAFRALVKHSLNDSVLPQRDRENSPGRDAQFELYLAAICQSAALSPVSLAEPDVNCTVDGTRYGIAAKRIKSQTQLRKHVCKAARQIRQTGIPGVIALDLSLAWNRNNLPIVSQLQSKMFASVAHLRATQFLDGCHDDIYGWVAHSNVLGLVVFDSNVRLQPDGKWGLEGMMTWLSTAQHDEQANREFERFQVGFLKGVPNLTNLAGGE